MTDPTPDAPSPFERACAQRYAAFLGIPREDAWRAWLLINEEQRHAERRGFAAGLRDLRGDACRCDRHEQRGADRPSIRPRHEWLDAILKDAPE